MSRVAFIAHCLLNQNAKVEEGAKTPAMWTPVIELLRERGYVIRQMPCPELAFGGARRFWGVREQYDTPLYRRHCQRVAKLVAAVMDGHVRAGRRRRPDRLASQLRSRGGAPPPRRAPRRPSKGVK